jgi:hypothetical protein
VSNATPKSNTCCRPCSYLARLVYLPLHRLPCYSLHQPDARKTRLDSDRASVQRITSIRTAILRVHNQTVALIPTILRLQVTIPGTALRASPRELVFYFAPCALHQVSVGMRSRLLCSYGWCDVLDGFLGQVEAGRLAYVIVIQPGHDDLAFFGALVFFGVVQVFYDFAFAGALELVEQATGGVLFAWLEFRGGSWPLRLHLLVWRDLRIAGLA